MARKHALKLGASNGSSVSVSGTDTPPSPAASGAMDDLLAKLRAAKPEARDQRDRRRRARLKDRHAVRVASGQTIQDMASLVNKRSETIEASLLSPASEVSTEAISDEGDAAPEGLDDEDVADRAASMLEGLRGEVGAEDPEAEQDARASLAREDSARIRRRRESAQDERAARRRRRQQAQSASEQSLGYQTIAEEAEHDGAANDKRDSSGSASIDGDIEVVKMRAAPVTVVHPPSPEVERSLPTPPADE